MVRLERFAGRLCRRTGSRKSIKNRRGPMKRFLPVLIAAATLAVAASAAQAQSREGETYGGVSLGPSRIKIDESFVEVNGATASSVSKDEKDFGFKLFAGRRMSRNFA